MTNAPRPTPSFHLDLSKFPIYHFELGPIRPPSEGQDSSLLIRVNRNCPWNRCLFCTTYKTKKFEYRSADEVMRDIDIAAAIAGGLKNASLALGLEGQILKTAVDAVVNATPEVYGRDTADEAEMVDRFSSLYAVANWLNAGAKTVFLQDANAMIMRQRELVAVIKHLKSVFPSIERVTSYGRTRTLVQRSLEELTELRESGLTRLHIGLESACDEVLAFMDKGVTGEQHIEAGQRAKAAGFSVSEYFMPGLGGRTWSEKHALESARALNAVDPDFIRLRSLIVRRGSDLYEKMRAGEFLPVTEEAMVDEIELFIRNLDCHAYLASDQMSNLLWEVEGQLPQDKEKILGIIRDYKSRPLFERLAFRLKRRARSYTAVHGEFPDDLERLVDEAVIALRSRTADAHEKTELAIAAIKQGFV